MNLTAELIDKRMREHQAWQKAGYSYIAAGSPTKPRTEKEYPKLPQATVEILNNLGR